MEPVNLCCKNPVAEQRLAPLEFFGLRDVGAQGRELADAATDLLVLWAQKDVPGKIIAQLMRHAKVDTTLNVYAQVLDGSLRKAAESVGSGMPH